MNFIWLGIALIVLGVLLGFTAIGGAFASIGWLLLIVGVVLALLSLRPSESRTH